jgi:hypothetical protein
MIELQATAVVTLFVEYAQSKGYGAQSIGCEIRNSTQNLNVFG